MLTKKRMLEIIAYVDSDISATEIKEIINKLSTEEKNFLSKFRKDNNRENDLSDNSKLEKYCYELSLDKVINDRHRKIDEILNS